MKKWALKYIVLHRTEGHVGGDIPTLVNGGGRSVSAHFYITLKGHVYQLLPLTIGANHAGYGKRGFAAKYGNANHHAIGIELEGVNTDKYTTEQLEALDTVIAAIDAYKGMKLPITTHALIDPERKSDPKGFRWLVQYNLHRSYKGAPSAAPKPAPAPVPAPAPAPKVRKLKVIVKDGLNVRSKPVVGKVLVAVPCGGELVQLGNPTLGWCKVKRYDHVGYIKYSKEYVKSV